MNNYILWLGLGFMVFLGIFFSLPKKEEPKLLPPLPSSVLVNNKTFYVEIANTEALRTKGLSGHVQLLSHEGMLFIFEKADKHSFWMKDMLFPIDIIWIGEDWKIVHMEKSVTPESYPKVFSPTEPALYVLEVSAGQAVALDLKIGDVVEFTKR